MNVFLTFYLWNDLTILWNDLTFLWNDLTLLWNEMTWNDLTMERSDRKPVERVVKSLANNKPPGTDKISSRVIIFYKGICSCYHSIDNLYYKQFIQLWCFP